MQLDQTHVSVRVRTLAEIGDLALVLLRQYPTLLVIGFAWGAMPWMIADGLLLYWLPIVEAEYGLDDPEAFTEISRYAIWMSLLVFLQTPSAGVLTTIYLGQAVFEKKPSWKSAMQIAKAQFSRWFYCLAIRRLAVPTMVLVGIRMFQPFDSTYDVMLPIVIFIVALIVRASRPFLPEMILLEMCPLRSKDDKDITLSRRAKALHRPTGNDVGSRWLAIGFFELILVATVFYTLMWARGILTGYWDFGLIALLAFFPLSLWIVGGLSVIVRMLSYLDTRIRLEGWDVELAVRAESFRQFGRDSTTMSDRPSTADPNSAIAATENVATETRSVGGAP